MLQDLWRRRAEEERGERPYKARAGEMFLDIKRAVEEAGNKELIRQFHLLEEAIVRYTEKVAELSSARSGIDRSAVESSDQNRRLAHERLIDELNILSRMFGKVGLDNRWREQVGLTREEIQDWAMAAVPLIENNQKNNNVFLAG